MYSVEKSNVWPDAAVRRSSRLNDDNRLVEFVRIYMLLTHIATGVSVAISHQSILYGT